MKKITVDKYEVLGNVVEMTNVELEKGGYADKYEINLTVEKINGNWLINEVIKEVVTGSETTAGQALIKDFYKLLVEGVRSYVILKFIDENISEAIPENADFMLEKLEYFQKSDIQFYTDPLFVDDYQVNLI